MSGKHTFELSVDVPEGTTGVVKVPVPGKITVNNRVQKVAPGEGIQLAGGQHVVSVIICSGEKN